MLVRNLFISGLVIIVVYTILTLIPSSELFAQNDTNVYIFPPDSKPYGAAYEDYIIKSWQRLYALPEQESPLTDPTGKLCSVGQDNNSSVFILTQTEGTTYTRDCKIPAGKGLLIEVVSVAASIAEVQNGNEEISMEDLYQVAKNDQDHVNLKYVSIDGQEIIGKELDKYRFVTRPFDIVIPDNDVFGIHEPGKSVAVADGTYLIIDALKPGKHTIVSKGSVDCYEADCAGTNYTTDVTYNLVVE